MRVAELKALARERGLRGYSWLRRTELIALLRSARDQGPQRPLGPSLRRSTRGPRSPVSWRPSPPQVQVKSVRPRQPSSQEMDIFEQQEMCKNRPVVTSKRNDWYDWLINNVLKTIKDSASIAFKTFKDKIVGFYNRVTGNRDQHEIEVLRGPWAPLRGGSSKPETFDPIEIEQAFGGAYRSYRVNGRPNVIDLITKELKTRNSAKIQMTACIRFAEDKDSIDKAFNSLMASD